MLEMDTGFHPLRAMRRGTVLLLLGVCLAVLCFGAGFFTAGQQKPLPQLSEITVEHQLQQVQELAATRYAYTTMGQFEQSNDFYGIRLPFTTKRFIVSYDGVITAGIDLGQAQVTVTDQEVCVTLPPAEILSHEIDYDSLEVFDETRNIFNPITIADYNGFQADQRGKMEEKALSAGLLPQAEQQAQAVVYSLLSPLLAPGQELTVSLQPGESTSFGEKT